MDGVDSTGAPARLDARGPRFLIDLPSARERRSHSTHPAQVGLYATNPKIPWRTHPVGTPVPTAPAAPARARWHAPCSAAGDRGSVLCARRGVVFWRSRSSSGWAPAAAATRWSTTPTTGAPAEAEAPPATAAP